MKKYKKKTSISGNVLATARILCTVLLACALGYIAFVLIFQGWQTVVDWFQGKWFAFATLIVLFAVTAGLWIFGLYRRMKGFEEDGKQG